MCSGCIGGLCHRQHLPDRLEGSDSAVRKELLGRCRMVGARRVTPPSSQSGRPSRAEVDQKNKKFIPHILAIPVGSTVDFPNSDPIFHNAFSNFEGKVFDIGLYAPGTSRSVRFDRPGVVRVFCNIHSTMSAVIVVLNTPYFAETNRDGNYHIPNVPVGEYILRLFHERASASTIEALVRRVNVRDNTAVIPPIAISESGFLPLRHKNKYGKEYPPAQEDSFYPGAKK